MRITDPLQRGNAVSGTSIEPVGLVDLLLVITLRMLLELRGRQGLDLLLAGVGKNAELLKFWTIRINISLSVVDLFLPFLLFQTVIPLGSFHYCSYVAV